MVRDELLSKEHSYSPMHYLYELLTSTAYARQPRQLAATVQRLATRYEVARRRCAYDVQRYPALSNYFVAQIYYKRLDPCFKSQIPDPDNLHTSVALPLQALIAAAGNVETRGVVVTEP